MIKVSSEANLFETAQSLREFAYKAGNAGNTQALQTWSALNLRAVSPCGKGCGHTSLDCKHCQPLGADGVEQVEQFLSRAGITAAIPDAIDVGSDGKSSAAAVPTTTLETTESPSEYFNGVPFPVGMARWQAHLEKERK